jgi:hypothetical protein
MTPLLGAGGETRTPDITLTMRTLYQLSYSGKSGETISKNRARCYFLKQELRSLHALTWGAILSTIPLVQSRISRSKGIAVRAYQPEVLLAVILPVSVNMIGDERDESRFWIYLCPATKAALVTVFLAQEPFYVG